MGAIAETKLRETEAAELFATRHWTKLFGVLIAAVVVCLTIDAVFDRNFSKNITDGVAYLDIAGAVAHGNPDALRNAYWSPGYPVALSIGLAVLRPPPALELAAIYAIHWVIGILALCSLVYFVRGLPPATDNGETFGLTQPILLASACALFLVAIQTDVPIELMTPDLLLAAYLWVGGGVFLRIARSQRMYHYALLGLVLALAYFTKTVGLSLVPVAAAILPFTGSNRKIARRGTIVLVCTVAALLTPYVARLSASKGRFTFGESGGLNYAWIVDGADGPNRWHLQNDSPHGHARMALLHPARRLLKSPDVYEFGSPVAGSFPIFDDPSYWDEGLKPVLYLRGQLWHIAMNLYHTSSWLGRRGEFVLALLVLWILQRRSRISANVREVLPVLLWFASLWGVYMLVDVEDRYVFAILTSILLLATAAVRLPDSARTRRAVIVCALILVGGVVIRSFDIAGEKVFYGVRQKFIGPIKMKAVGPYQNPYWEAAQTLTGRLGLRRNDSVACMRLGCDNTYWARLAGLRVTADISAESDYWAAAPADRARAMAVLAAAGVKAVVTRRLGAGAEAEGWIPLTDPHETPAQDLYARLTK